MATVTSVHGQKAETNFGPIRGRPPVRGTANRKERKRTQTINSAFSELRDRIPNVPADTKLSKIKTLRLAISYIRYLMQLLDEAPDPASPVILSDRSRERIALEIATKCDESERRKREDQVAADAPILRPPPRNNANVFLPRKRGRTGWPQHVWAMELKHESSSSP